MICEHLLKVGTRRRIGREIGDIRGNTRRRKNIGASVSSLAPSLFLLYFCRKRSLPWLLWQDDVSDD